MKEDLIEMISGFYLDIYIRTHNHAAFLRTLWIRRAQFEGKDE